MILLLAGCSPDGTTFTEAIEPGGYAVFVNLRAIVVLPMGAVDAPGPFDVHLTPEAGPGSFDALDAFEQPRSLEAADRFYRVELDVDGLSAPMWIGRWEEGGVTGTLYTAVDTPDGWRAAGHFDTPGIEVDPVLLHPDRTWFPTTSTRVLHGTAGTSVE